MKNRLVLVPVAAVLLLLVGIAARHDLMLRTAVVCVGILVTLAGMGIVAARKSSRKYLLELAVILAAYVLYAGTGFQTTDLGAFLPEDCTVQRVDITVRETGEHVIWTPGGEASLSEDNGQTALTGGSAEDVRQQAGGIVMCSYWRPGFVESAAASAVSIDLTSGGETCRVSLSQDENAQYSLSVQWESDETAEQSDWLLFADPMSLLPPDVAALLS